MHIAWRGDVLCCSFCFLISSRLGGELNLSKPATTICTNVSANAHGQTTTFISTNISKQMTLKTNTVAHRTATINILPTAQNKSVAVAANAQSHSSRYSHTLAFPTR